MNTKEQFLDAVKANQAAIHKIAAVYTNTIEDKSDLVQEIHYHLWKSFDSFSNKSAIGTWIYRVALNVAILQLQKSKKRVTTVLADEQLLATKDPESSHDDELWKQLRIYIDRLNLLDKGIVVLYLEDKSYEEIAEIVGISASNVGTRLSRIKEKLRKQITKN